jgi:hypothetical protein
VAALPDGVLRDAAPQAGDGDDPPDTVPPDRLAQRQREVAEVALDAVGARRGRHQPEHPVGTVAGRAEEIGVGVRALEHLGPLTCPGSQAAGVAGDHPDRGRFVQGVENVVEDLSADTAGRGGDDDHGTQLRFKGGRMKDRAGSRARPLRGSGACSSCAAAGRN